MAWVKIDDQFADHPKIREVGPIGMAIQVSALCYCNRFLTDGFISNQAATAIILGLSKDKNWPEKMVASGLWEKHGNGFIINDYLEYNPSKNEVLELRTQRKNAAQRGAKSTNEKRWGSPKESASRRPPSEPSSDDNVIAPVPVPVPHTYRPPVSANAETPPPQAGGGAPPVEPAQKEKPVKPPKELSPKIIGAVNIWNEKKADGWDWVEDPRKIPALVERLQRALNIDGLYLPEIIARARESDWLSSKRFCTLLWLVSKSKRTGDLNAQDVMNGIYDNQTTKHVRKQPGCLTNDNENQQTW